MNKERLSRQKFTNIFIAFAIAWLSLSSIIDFHIHKIYEKDIFGKIEFIKTDSKKSIVFKTETSQNTDLNTFFCESSENTSLNQVSSYYTYAVVSVWNQQQCINSAISQRGPPSIIA